MKRKISHGVVNAQRIRDLIPGSDGPRNNGPVIYWMSRDQRVQDNWAFLHAQDVARSVQAPLVCCFNLLLPSSSSLSTTTTGPFLGATLRAYHFMLHGLKEVEQECRLHNVDFFLLCGEPKETIPELVERLEASMVVCDFSPLRITRRWKHEVGEGLKKKGVPFVEVDAHNVVPAWTMKSQETAARTIRPKLWKVAEQFLESYPQLEKHPHSLKKGSVSGQEAQVNVENLLEKLQCDKSVAPVDWIAPGASAATKGLQSFLQGSLKSYENDRNLPFKDGTSNLSPWLHFGHLSPQRAVMDAMAVKKKSSSLSGGVDAFVEELFVRRELAENFCLFNAKYDSIEGAADWARQTLREHSGDAREYVYSAEQLEKGETHDVLWNAAQLEMVKRGKMQGFMRMYWCKKILEWTESPEAALKIAIDLNDKYELDGRDPNGYVGCMWSICGVHDMGFKERPVFGKIRWMCYDGCLRKFKQAGIDAYVKKWGNASNKGGPFAAAAAKKKK